MRALLRSSLGLLVLLLAASTGDARQTAAGTAAPGQAEPPTQDLVTTLIFQQNVDEYARLHRMLEASLPPLRSTTKVDEIEVNSRLLATRVMTSRNSARQGHFFTPDVGRLMRRRIATCLTPDEWQAVLAELAETEDGVPVPAVTLRVNMSWPAQVPFGFVPPHLLAALPSLPEELQYRIIGNSLVLWDHHANLIVDFLPAAFITS